MSEPMKPSKQAMKAFWIVAERDGVEADVAQAQAIDFATQRTVIDGLVEALETTKHVLFEAGTFTPGLREDIDATLAQAKAIRNK